MGRNNGDIMNLIKQKALSAAQMREADRRCIEELGVPGVVLMNTAGAAVFKHIQEGPVGIVCGKGNNGGDGYVVARMALLAGLKPYVVLVAKPEQIQGDAAIFLSVYRRLGGTITVATTEAEATTAVNELKDCRVLVDALLGTGVKGTVRGPVGAAIAAWPQNVRTIAVDLPSGLNADTGEVCGHCVRANLTVTFQCAKTGLCVPEAAPWVGELEVADIGIPPVCMEDAAWTQLKRQKNWQ